MHVEGIHYATGMPVRITMDGEMIGDLRTIDSGEGLPFIAPCLIDLQINGYAGLDFNAIPLPAETLGKAVRLLWREGVTSFCPTVITNSDDAITGATAAIARECDEDPIVNRAVAGIHLEGPFISSEDGPRGAHARQHVRPPDFDAFERWQQAAGGRIRIVTMSPEWPGSGDFISRAAGSGVVVSIGHTAATPDQVREAVAAGARLSTHLGNGAHLMLPRHPNYVWTQLAHDELWTTLIADGFHLPDEVLKVVMKVKGDRAMLVSDAVALCGMPPGEYQAPVGGRVVLTPEGKLHLADNDRLLAGSAKPLISGVEHVARAGLASLHEAWEMACVRPASFLGLPQSAGLSPGSPADIAVFRQDVSGRIRLERTLCGGKIVHEAGV